MIHFRISEKGFHILRDKADHNNPEMSALYRTEQYDAWMGDEVHPHKSGYVEWWTPVIDAYLTEYMSK